ncbi:MAG: zinc-binding dehydrogenase [Gemmatimonadota bacterium]
MPAAVLEAPCRIRLLDVPVPQPGPGEVRVRLEGCGVCGSNLGPWEGQAGTSFPLPAGAPGHEGWGVVDALGDGVDSPRIGTRVALLSYRAYAAYDVATADAVVPLPPEIEGRPFPAEPLACALNVLRRSGIGSGDTVAVVGVGFLGALLARLAVGEGARVIGVSQRPFALEIARAMGAEAALRLGHDDVLAAVQDLTGGELCDVAIEAAGKQATLDLAAELTRVRGRLVIAGYHQDGPRRVNLQLWNWRGLDVVNAHERDSALYVQGMRAAAEAVVSGRLDPDPLYTHTFPLERLGEALEATRERPAGFLKALVVP